MGWWVTKDYVSCPSLTSAWPPGDRTVWQCSHFRQKRCQFLPRELTFSAVGDKVEPAAKSQAKHQMPPTPHPQPAPFLRDQGVSLGIQLYPAPASCTPHSSRRRGGDHTPQQVEKGIWNHTVANQPLNPQGTQWLTLISSFPPPQPRPHQPHQSKQAAGNVGRSSSWCSLLGEAAFPHWTPLQGSVHWLLPPLSSEPTELSWCSFDTRNLEPFHLGDVGNFSVTSKSIKASIL